MNRRRRYVADWPQRLPATRKRLGRLLLIVAVGFTVSVWFSARAGAPAGAPEASAPPSPAPAASSTTRPAATPATPLAGSVALELRGDGWYLPQPEAWPIVSVDRVLDGDTLDVHVSGVVLRVRVFGVNTPERGERCFAEASERLGVLAGREVRLVADQRQQDRFGRELRYLFTPSGRSIDATLLDEGYALAWREDGALRSTLVPIEEAARAAGRGCLWAG